MAGEIIRQRCNYLSVLFQNRIRILLSPMEMTPDGSRGKDPWRAARLRFPFCDDRRSGAAHLLCNRFLSLDPWFAPRVRSEFRRDFPPIRSWACPRWNLGV